MRRLDRDMGARLPNVNDPASVEHENRFGYLESSVLPSQYYDAVDVSVDLVRRVGRMVDTLNAMSRRRSIANASIVQGV